MLNTCNSFPGDVTHTVSILKHFLALQVGDHGTAGIHRIWHIPGHVHGMGHCPKASDSKNRALKGEKVKACCPVGYGKPQRLGQSRHSEGTDCVSG